MKHPSAAIQGKSLTNRYQKYLRNKRSSSDTSGTSFTDKLTSVPATAAGKTTAPVDQRSFVKSQQYHLPDRTIKEMNITLKQACRLAKYAPLITDASRRHNVPVELICGVILQESGARATAKSHCGAQGLMQLMPATARRFGVKNSYDPAQNIEGGVKYLKFLLDRFKGNIELAVAAYNAGEGNVEKYGNRIPPFRETRAYVPAVLGYTKMMVKILTPARSEPSLAAAELPSHARRA